jgi:hypothetical protein
MFTVNNSLQADRVSVVIASTGFSSLNNWELTPAKNGKRQYTIVDLDDGSGIAP